MLVLVLVLVLGLGLVLVLRTHLILFLGLLRVYMKILSRRQRQNLLEDRRAKRNGLVVGIGGSIVMKNPTMTYDLMLDHTFRNLSWLLLILADFVTRFVR